MLAASSRAFCSRSARMRAPSARACSFIWFASCRACESASLYSCSAFSSFSRASLLSSIWGRMSSCRSFIDFASGGTTYFEIAHRMIRNAKSSAKNDALGTRKLLARYVCCSMGLIRLLGEDENEIAHEREVDEVHGLDQTDRDVEQGRESACRFRLTRDTGDVLATGQTIPDGRADSATTQGEATADHCAREGYCLLHVLYSHVLVS